MKKSNVSSTLNSSLKMPVVKVVLGLVTGAFLWYIYPYFFPVIESEKLEINLIGESVGSGGGSIVCPDTNTKYICEYETKPTTVQMGKSKMRRLVKTSACGCKGINGFVYSGGELITVPKNVTPSDIY